jgi:hypothetical protein
MSTYTALSTANLPDPAIDPAAGEEASDHFNTVLWTGDGSSGRSITTGHQPDWVWTKERNSAIKHIAQDSVLGTGKYLHPNTTQAEQSASTLITSFDSNGFTIGNSGSINGSSDTYVAWSWKAGTSFSNDASATGVGTIDSTGTVNTKAGFSIISYTGTGSSGTIAHGLGVAPAWFIVKNRDDGDAAGNTNGNWLVFHQSLSTNQWLKLETTDSAFTNSDAFGGVPSSTTIQLGTFNSTNGSGDRMICYAFAEKEGYSKFGSYVGNGSADGPFIYTGFRVSMVILKRTDSGGSWTISDSVRDTSNPITPYLFPAASDAEATDTSNEIDFLSNGFKLRHDTRNNTSSATYIFMAFADQPFKFSNAR